MEKDYRVIIGVVIFSVCLIILSFGFYKFFSSKNPTIISNLEIEFLDSGRTIVNDDVSDDEESAVPYAFSIRNKSNVKTRYKVILNDNNNKESSISRDKFQYSLLLNGELISSGKLNEIENDVLDLRSIGKKSVNKYDFKVWLIDNIKSNEVYTYSLRVEPIL